MHPKPDSNALIPPPTNSPEITQAFAVLAEADRIEVPKMSEPMFKEHILPMLTAPAGTQVDMTRWIDVAGTPLRAIDVVDPIHGNTLFRVPPLMRSLPTVYQQEVNYSNIIVEAQARENIHSSQADGYLRREFGKARIAAPKIDLETATQWNLILARYDLPLLPIPGAERITSGSLTMGNSGALAVDDDQEDF